MRLIRGGELKELVDSVVIGSTLPVGVNELDIRLGKQYWVERELSYSQRVHVMKPEDWQGHLQSAYIPEHGMSLLPQHFMLVEAKEQFVMPEYVMGLLTLRSWAAKSGLEQSSSLTLKPGWKGPLILELFNSLQHNELFITPGLPVAQVQFFDINRSKCRHYE